MSLTINTNTAAVAAAHNLSKNNQNLQKSLMRLSSGSKITSPSDDAGGLAVSMKLNAAINRTSAAMTNVQNATSFAEVQDGGLQAAARIVDRMAELKALSLDVMKSTTDIANYDTEFQALREQLWDISTEEFNGVSMFTQSATAVFGTAGTYDASDNTKSDYVKVLTSEKGSSGSSVVLYKSKLRSAVTFNDLATPTAVAAHSNAASLAFNSAGGGSNDIVLSGVALDAFKDALDNIATLRSENGATVSRFSFAEDHLSLSKANLQAANSRIMDVDIATETTNLARYNILVQASASMLAQANLAPNSALLLLS